MTPLIQSRDGIIKERERSWLDIKARLMPVISRCKVCSISYQIDGEAVYSTTYMAHYIHLVQMVRLDEKKMLYGCKPHEQALTWNIYLYLLYSSKL